MKSNCLDNMRDSANRVVVEINSCAILQSKTTITIILTKIMSKHPHNNMIVAMICNYTRHNNNQVHEVSNDVKIACTQPYIIIL